MMVLRKAVLPALAIGAATAAGAQDRVISPEGLEMSRHVAALMTQEVEGARAPMTMSATIDGCAAEIEVLTHYEAGVPPTRDLIRVQLDDLDTRPARVKIEPDGEKARFVTWVLRPEVANASLEDYRAFRNAYAAERATAAAQGGDAQAQREARKEAMFRLRERLLFGEFGDVAREDFLENWFQSSLNPDWVSYSIEPVRALTLPAVAGDAAEIVEQVHAYTQTHCAPLDPL